MADEKKEKARVRKPSALKRDQQSKRRNVRNRTFKSTVATALRSFKGALDKKDANGMKQALDVVSSLMDKGVKKHVFKLNKASRVKSRLSAAAKKVAKA